MNVLRAASLAICLMACCCLPANLAWAQPRTLTVRESFEPTFHIEPLVQRLSGRRGSVLPFEFKVEATNRDTEVEIALVNLRQEITGQVVHDEILELSDSIKLLNPGRSKLPRDKPLQIGGVVRVPAGDANFYSYGILVRDIGNAPPPPPKLDNNGKPITSAGIKFITQYVLRVDLEVEGARGDNAAELSIEDAKLTTSRGLPKVSVVIRNPCDTAFEYQVKSRLKSQHSANTRAIRMTMPVRASMETEDRYVGRVLPKSSVRMEEIVAEPIMTGQYQMEVDLLMNERVVKQRTFTISADANDFPAQQALLSRAGEDLYAAPVYLEFSQLRGGQRRLTMEFSNTSDKAREMELEAQTDRGTPLPGVSMTPSTFTLPPKGKRKVSITMHGKKDIQQPIEYGYIVVKNKTADRDFTESGRMPVAMRFAATPEPQLEMDKLYWSEDDKVGCFRTHVTNRGEFHAVLDAQLTIESETGQRMQIPAGFGRWIMPGQQLELEFRPDSPMPPGNYRLTTELQNGLTPLIKTQQVTVSDVAQVPVRKTRSDKSEKNEKSDKNEKK